MKITIDDVLSHNPCDDYDTECLEELYAGREALTPREIAALNIPAAARLWALIHCGMTARQLRLFACDCATRLTAARDALLKAIQVARIYIAGNSDTETLRDAYAEAASVHHSAAYIAYAAATAEDPACANFAFETALFAAAAAAKAGDERKWQLRRALQYCEEQQ